MKKFTYTCGSAFVLMLFFVISFTVYADEGISARLSGESYKAGDTVKVTVNVPENQNTAAFLLEVYYDSEKLSFKKTDNLSSCYMKSSDKDGSVSIAALAKSGVFSGDAFSLSFKLLDDSEENEIELAFRDLVDSNGEKSAEDLNCSLAVKPYEKPSGECELKKLVPSEGELNEEFSSDKYSYTMSVPYSVKSLSFDCTVSDGATYKVNRKNLGSGGSTTDFKITVTSADGRNKTEYIVSVTRGEYVRASGTKKGTSSKSSESEEKPLILSLVPSEGKLNEEFSSDVNNYTMNLPYDIKKLEFKVEVSDGASYTINRTTLGKGGSTVDFKITVKSADGKSKNIYVISVTRGEKDETSSKSKSKKSESSKEYIEPETLAEYNAESKLTIVGDRLPGFIIVVFLTAMLVMLTLICVKIFRKK